MRLTTPINYPLCDAEYEINRMTHSSRSRKQRKHTNHDFCSLSEKEPYLVPLIKQRGSINIL